MGYWSKTLINEIHTFNGLYHFGWYSAQKLTLKTYSQHGKKIRRICWCTLYLSNIVDATVPNCSFGVTIQAKANTVHDSLQAWSYLFIPTRRTHVLHVPPGRKASNANRAIQNLQMCVFAWISYTLFVTELDRLIIWCVPSRDSLVS